MDFLDADILLQFLFCFFPSPSLVSHLDTKTNSTSQIFEAISLATKKERTVSQNFKHKKTIVWTHASDLLNVFFFFFENLRNKPSILDCLHDVLDQKAVALDTFNLVHPNLNSINTQFCRCKHCNAKIMHTQIRSLDWINNKSCCVCAVWGQS